ncbi:extracellular calcium-sensing receptor-like, partial [Scleropages formosus]
MPSFSQEGQINLGGVFSFHRKPGDSQNIFTVKPKTTNCQGEYQLAQTMIFAIEEINNRTDILPGVTLGYKIYDTCASVTFSVQSAMALMNGYEEMLTDTSCSRPAAVKAIIGESGSTNTIAIAARTKINGLKEFVLKLHPSNHPNNSDVKDFWEAAFQCSVTKETSSNYKTPCTGSESLTELKNQYTDESEIRITNNVYKAVYAVAYSLHSQLECMPQKGCAKNLQTEPWQVLDALKKVNFTLRTGERVFFDGNGDPAAKYEVVNWQLGPNGAVEFKAVGYYDATLPPGQQFVMSPVDMAWAGGQKQKPTSVCSESCPSGTRKAVRRGKPVCCYDCVPCAEGEISNKTDSNDCIPCDLEYWSNEKRDRCVLKTVEFLSFEEVMG